MLDCELCNKAILDPQSLRKICIAPMLGYTDRHFRYLLRLISRHVMLYSEMVATGAVLNNDPKRFLAFNEIEHPIALQLGGNNPQQLAHCCKIAKSFGYDEVNLNLGCPSSRVQAGNFGVCLMQQPDLVADCVKAMVDAADIPISVKTRIGINGRDSYEELVDFMQKIVAAGCQTFIIHARIADLEKFSPKENRNKPQLNYEAVYRLKRDFPQLNIIINGEIKTIKQINHHLLFMDGVMIGQEAYHNPYSFIEFDRMYFYDDHAVFSREEIVAKYLNYIKQEHEKHDIPLKLMSRHLMGLFKGTLGAKKMRKMIALL
jgi:tRNA-dihydrouridine synthase A